MRIKALLTSILLASTTIAGVASASPIVRDHRDQPTVTYQAPVRYQNQTGVQSRPSWMVNASANVNYGFQVSANGKYVQPYTYGNDPYVEGIARNQWVALDSMVIDSNPSTGHYINVNGRSLQALELQATAGCSQVTKIGVRTTDGRAFNIEMNRTLDAHSPNLRVDLGPSARVERVFIYGSGGGTVRVLAA